MKTERTLFTLSDKQLQLFNVAEVCKNTCMEVVKVITKLQDDNEIRLSTAKDLIYAAAKLYEDNEDSRTLIYKKIIEDYNLTPEEVDRLDINNKNGVVRILSKDYKENEIIKKRFNKMWR
jgi:hypothetical protein